MARGEVKIYDMAIELVETTLNLGLIMDPQQKYIEHVNQKLAMHFFMHLREDIRLKLVDSLVLPLFNYCILSSVLEQTYTC